MVFPYLSSLFSKKSNKTQLKPTIFDTFPELNQGQAYLQRRNKVRQAMKGHLNLIESLTMQVSSPPVPTCKYVAQAQPNVIVPCKCGNTTCSSANPYCNSETKQCYNTSSNAASVDWAYKASCPLAGQSSSCQPTPGCPNYGFCPPKQSDLLWKKDGCPGGSGVVGCKPPFDKMTSQINMQYGGPYKDKAPRALGGLYKDYMDDVNKYINNPPTGLLGQNVVVPQLGGAASPWPPAGLLPQGHCNYLNVCAPKSENLTEQEIVHGEKGPTTIEEAANAAAAKYGFTCKSYDSTTYGPDVKFIVGGQPVEVQQDFCALEGGNINVTPSTSLTSLKGASYGAGHGGLVLLH